MTTKIITSTQEMLDFGAEFAKNLTLPACLQLVGDVGAGKTTFMRGVARGLGISEPVTSPSFTISKVYESPLATLIHYDFYRLDDPGLMLDDLADSLSLPDTLVAVEWAGDAAGLLPDTRLLVTISVNPDSSRTITLSSPHSSQ